MKTSELLQYVAKDMLDDRAEMLSGESDQLFSDATIARHLAEAERVLCRRAWVLEDAGASAATRIQLVENKVDYPLHKSILFIKSVRLSDTDVDLLRAGYDDNRARGSLSLQAPGFWDVNAAYIENAGRPSRFSTDVGMRTIRVRSKPDADAALLKLNLVVVRMPINAISHTTPDAEPECPEEFHMDLCTYAAGKCLVLPSIDSSLRSLGKQWLEDFDDRVREAKRDRQRLQQSAPRHRFGAWAADSYSEK
jgi:hypothetical protein